MPISNIDHFLMVTTFPILSSSFFFFLRKVTRTWRLVTVTLHQLLTSSGCNELCLKSVYKSFAATLLFLRFQDSGNHFTLKYEMHIFKFHVSDIVQYLCFFDWLIQFLMLNWNTLRFFSRDRILLLYAWTCLHYINVSLLTHETVQRGLLK